MEPSNLVKKAVDPFMPLVTVEKNKKLLDIFAANVRWNSIASEHATANKIERECAETHDVVIPRCRYFYAGHALDRYGEAAFAYEPQDEMERCGTVNPFDTGALYLGKMHPFANHTTVTSPTDEETRKKNSCKFIQDTKIDLSNWRKEFSTFTDRCYDGNVLSYLNGERPPTPHTWGDARLPFNDPANRESCAWIWEVRIEELLPVEQGLFAWSCTTNQKQSITLKLNDMKGMIKPRTRAHHFKIFSEKWIRPDTTQTPCGAVQQKIIHLFSGRKKTPS
ncbi:MAG: hypothetical protein HQL81_15310 [Magnetococcales bacterium]|nr:hypothetical protein [Magnetococcales bacterium]